ncbi:sigma factor SigB regulation protein RsbQ [Oleiphilus sp. HI0117]|nr:sigma factor SigB regulation protein RsbQ [Oleiphilus sp. HI0050]KZZ34146.1 sigma factor SigB regulation protein RsbQ [Oleiphilus sp. HI0117]KZZ34371.1 sigma factor SigB regulation protein RsbQ [Oleiphilus sp. HI0086]KZZ53322.1 sigma factor SigB regulation protein RsbQ [Oleiphilus sp. HI0123]
MCHDKAEILKRNNVNISGNGDKIVLLAHGFGCDQNMWRFMLPALEKQFKVVLFDYVGSGKSDLNSFSKKRYASLDGYAKDIEEILLALDLSNVSIIGHSVSSIIAGIASINCGDRISDITMICPSPCFMNIPPDYMGGFEREDLEELINLMDKNYIGWANYLAPLVMGAGHSPELIGELSGSFCSTDPVIAKTFAIATFFSDYRTMLRNILKPTFIFQSLKDSLAAPEVGKYMAENINDSQLALIEAEGHCPHMTDPALLMPLLIDFINRNKA